MQICQAFFPAPNIKIRLVFFSPSLSGYTGVILFLTASPAIISCLHILSPFAEECFRAGKRSLVFAFVFICRPDTPEEFPGRNGMFAERNQDERSVLPAEVHLHVGED